MAAKGYRWGVADRLRLTIAFDEPDEEGWIVARVLEVPGAMSQGRTRTEARENAIDALRQYGLVRGVILAGWRLLRCNPWSKGGVDYAHQQRLFR